MKTALRGQVLNLRCPASPGVSSVPPQRVVTWLMKIQAVLLAGLNYYNLSTLLSSIGISKKSMKEQLLTLYLEDICGFWFSKSSMKFVDTKWLYFERTKKPKKKNIGRTWQKLRCRKVRWNVENQSRKLSLVLNSRVFFLKDVESKAIHLLALFLN